MEYCWDVKSIRNRLISIEKDSKSSSKIRRTIYSSMLDDMNGVVYKRKEQIDKTQFFYKLGTFDISYFNNSFFKMINYINSCTNSLITNIETKSINSINPNEIIGLCNNFYRKNDKTSLNYFKRIISRTNSLQYIDYDSELLFIGRSYIASLEEYYILINARNNFESVSATIHEGKHIESYMKGYNNGIKFYQELAPILYEMYSIDYLEEKFNNDINTNILRVQNISKYLNLINVICNSIDFIKEVRINNDYWNDVYDNYELLYDEYNIDYIYSIMCNGLSSVDIGTIISFIVAVDMYVNCSINNANNVISCYVFGLYSLKPSSIEGVIQYINDTLKKDKEKIKKHNK